MGTFLLWFQGDTFNVVQHMQVCGRWPGLSQSFANSGRSPKMATNQRVGSRAFQASRAFSVNDSGEKGLQGRETSARKPCVQNCVQYAPIVPHLAPVDRSTCLICR
jgi:hypothetical protein